VLLDADWPGRVCSTLEADGAVALVTQGAAGNASARLQENEAADGFAQRFTDAARAQAPGEAQAQVDLALASVRVGLPRPDASRLVPGPLRAATENVLCEGAPNTVELDALRLGPLALLAVPVEPTFEAGKRLEAQAGAQRVLGLANGYSGYLDTEVMVRGGGGESARQYFGGELLGLLEDGATLAGSAAGLRAP